MNMTKSKLNRRNGQTMVEYIIIVVLIAISLLVLFGKLSKATGKKVAGATAALDDEVGSEAKSLAEEDPADKIKTFE
jgi:Flp pilus assembly pilin Flp